MMDCVANQLLITMSVYVFIANITNSIFQDGGGVCCGFLYEISDFIVMIVSQDCALVINQ